MNTACEDRVFHNKNWQWQAQLQLELGRHDRGTHISRSRHQGPLYVQKPFYPEGKDCAHIYLLHPPGGLVSGDTLEVEISLKETARALVTTPGAARMYRARQSSPIQRQLNSLQLDKGAVLEWFPMEAIVYPGAAVKLNTDIKLAKGSSFVGWEMTCLGLPASNQEFITGEFQQNYRFEYDGLPVFIDRLKFSADNKALLAGRAGLQSQAVSGFMIAGPFDEKGFASLIDSLRAIIGHRELDQAMAVTRVDQFLVVRYLGVSAFQCRQAFIQLWRKFRPVLLGREACEPRIWAT